MRISSKRKNQSSIITDIYKSSIITDTTMINRKK